MVPMKSLQARRSEIAPKDLGKAAPGDSGSTVETDGVATRTVLCHERLSARDTIVRLAASPMLTANTIARPNSNGGMLDRFSISASWTMQVNSLGRELTNLVEMV